MKYFGCCFLLDSNFFPFFSWHASLLQLNPEATARLGTVAPPGPTSRMPLPDPPSSSSERSLASDGVDHGQPLSFSNQARPTGRPPLPLPPTSSAHPPLPTGGLYRVEALFDCEADQEDELSFTEGELVIVTDETDADWWFGYIESDVERYGVFPVLYVKVLR